MISLFPHNETAYEAAEDMLAEMLSLPDDWDYTLKGLTFLFSDGIDSVRQGIRELEEHGYVVRLRNRYDLAEHLRHELGAELCGAECVSRRTRQH